MAFSVLTLRPLWRRGKFDLEPLRRCLVLLLAARCTLQVAPAAANVPLTLEFLGLQEPDDEDAPKLDELTFIDFLNRCRFCLALPAAWMQKSGSFSSRRQVIAELATKPN